jgi:hypothetical protein
MNCVQFERVLPDYLEGGHTPEQQAHLNSCPACSGLLADLNLIASQARLLQAIDEPSPRVWNALESQLRREGLIRGPEPTRPRLADFLLRWRAAWLVPVAAVLVIAAGIKLYQPAKVGDTGAVAKQVAIPSPAHLKPVVRGPAVSSEDEQLLNSFASRVPTQQASYKANLDDANAFIRDAEESVRNDPNDVETQQLLINAYEQKQMLYDLAVDRNGGQ